MKRDHGPTLLIIEDDLIVRKALASYLNSFAYTVLEAEDGETGLEIFHKSRPDLVLTDLRISGLDGMEVLSNIREDSPDTPVIIVSGMGTMDDAIKALQLGAVDYVTKPIADMALLRHAVEKALERSRLVLENRQYQSHLEEEIERRTAELQQAQKMEAIGTLAGGIAHDFNNILEAIMGFIDLALLKAKGKEDFEEDLRQIKTASQRARDLVQQILTFSRTTPTTRQPIQASLIIKEALKLMRATIPATVEIKENIDGEEAMIMANPTEIHQIITNLCTNAFHALFNEQGTITIDVATRYHSGSKVVAGSDRKAGGFLMLRVTDNGRGMNRETLDQMFNPFFTTKEQGRGTGLGLSVVKSIVDESGATIQAESKVDKGSIFTLLFPLVEAAARRKESDARPIRGGSERIIMVDDEKALRVLGERWLSHLGYSAVCVNSGKEALERIKNDRDAFDLLITDQSMPNMSGTELVREVQKICPVLPIILCTGFSTVVDEQKAAALGIDGFLNKPVLMKTLAQEIRRILDRQPDDSKYP